MRLRHVHLARFIKVPREGSGESYSLKERTLSQTPKGCSCFLVVVVVFAAAASAAADATMVLQTDC